MCRGERDGKCTGGFSTLGVEGGVNVRVDNTGEGGGDGEMAPCGRVGVRVGDVGVTICF